MLLRIYNIFTWIALPVIPFVLLYRLKRGKEERGRILERIGITTRERPEGKLLWFHAASMGESSSIMPVIERLLEKHDDIHIMLTTVTVSSARNVGRKLPDRAFHQYAPLDNPLIIYKFLKHWKPNTAFWVESEFWPNMMMQTKKTGCPMVLLNARISQKSADRWQRIRSVIQEILECFSLVLAKSEEDAARLKNLGADNVIVQGNLKFSAPPLEADPKVTSDILAQIVSRHVWLAASTHAGEEEIIGRIHLKLQESYNGLLTIITPRHSHRGREIANQLEKMGLKVARRSKGDEVTNDTDIYLADTMGELGIMYRLTGIVFVGGTLVPHGGQNPFEPALLDCAILYGPHMYNFNEFCTELEAVHGAIKVKDEEELTEKVDMLLRDYKQQEELAKAALSAVKAKAGVIDKVMETIEPYV